MYILLSIICCMVSAILICFLGECGIAIQKEIALRYETIHDVAKVVDKYYDESAIKWATGIYAYDKYNVYILYKGEEYCFDDKELHEKVKIGDSVNILIHKGFNKCGKLKRTYLSIEE